MARAGLLGVVMVGAALVAVVAACGDEVSAIGTPDGGAGAETSTTDGAGADDTGTGVTDAGADGGEVIGDGGSNIDPDASDDDAGLDAAVCNAVVNDAPAIMSACSSILPPLTGGALVAGKYHLTNVAALAQPGFCQNQFVPASFKQTMELTVDGNGVGTANTAAQIAGQAQRSRTTTLDPGANDTSPMVATATCPARPGGNVTYFSGVRQDKQVIVMRLEYGQGQALYRFEKQ